MTYLDSTPIRVGDTIDGHLDGEVVEIDGNRIFIEEDSPFGRWRYIVLNTGRLTCARRAAVELRVVGQERH